MSQNENLYKFIDKDKLTQYLTTPELWHRDDDSWMKAYQELLDKINAGFFSFQKGGE
jgi:hypothetical protein